MFSITMTKVESTHKNLRTDVVKGLAPELPQIGKHFFMYSNEVLTPDTSIRYVYTSLIQDVKEKDNEIVFRTENSVYVLSNIEEIIGNETNNETNDERT